MHIMTVAERREFIRSRTTTLRAAIKAETGHDVEITIRGPKAFTFDFEANDPSAIKKVARYFEGLADVTGTSDDECGTFIYVDAR